MLTRDEALKICETVLGAREGGRRRGRRSCRVQSSRRIARAVCRQPHHHQRPLRGPDITATVWVGQRRGVATGNDAERRRAEATGRRGGADRARLAGASRVRADARCRSTYPASARFRRGDRRRRSRRRARRRSQRVLDACRGAKVTGAGFHSATRVGHRGGDRQRQSPLLPLERGRPQRDGAHRRRHRLGLLRRRSLRPRPARRRADRRAGGGARRCARATRSRSSRASTR